MANKAPAFQFYVADHIQDTRCLSLAAKGAWTDCLCAMWRSQIKGEITYPLVGFARLFGCTVEQAKAVVDELVEMQICDRVTHDDGKMTLINRRMKREAKEREAANNRQKNYVARKKQQNDAACDGENDGDVTSYSSSSSSKANTFSSEKDIGWKAGESPPSDQREETDEEYLTRKQKEFKKINVRVVYRRYLTWCKERNFSPKRRYFDNWLATEDEPLTADFIGENDNEEIQRSTAKPKNGKLAKDEYALRELELSQRNRREVERELDALRKSNGDGG